VPEPCHPIPSSLAAVQDHARQFADFTYVYPVISRRSRGLSIGINLNPDKVCNFNCIYCEVDRQTPGRAARLDVSRMRDELVAMVRLAKEGVLTKEPKFAQVPALTRNIKDLALSGDGEPTMIRNFAECVRAVAEVKEAEQLPDTKIVLITNAAGLDKADVKRGLELMDAHQGEIWGKLDAGTEAYFKLVNRSSVRFERILKNLLETARLRPIVIQSLFLKVHGQPLSEAELSAYCERLCDLTGRGAQIREVHAYTVARPTPEVYATRLTRAELEGVARRIRARTQLDVMIFE
jgi:wyosine [tRNA(Phe)-imidazoG37] synthetase (radical SAM superfamily)